MISFYDLLILRMDTRRDFIKKAGLLSGTLGMNAFLPEAIKKALSIQASPGTTWKDAEHIVILMQENRSFDHTYGSLRGVRGFNDPRAIRLKNNNPVWLQTDAAGQTYAPFRLDIKDTKATWMSSLPHSWKNQVKARNDGKYDQWLIEKRNSIHEYSTMPLTLGYHTREDIPFYYALADGFTVCDQHFCSALTGTDPNRLFFWTGTIRAEQHENSKAHVWNEDVDYESLSWSTFPELLEANEVSWKFYQNELSIDVGFKDEEDQWLSNFQDNPLEFFSQYNIRMHGKHLQRLQHIIDNYPKEIAEIQKQVENLNPSDTAAPILKKGLDEKKKTLANATKDIEKYNQEKFNNLSSRKKNLHRKAFVTNTNDPDYHSLETLTYDDNGQERKMKVPKGDLLHQFREDVNAGNLPTISWLASPENLSDHPASAWYGAWYVSEVMDILTQNPEIWQKTIFILTYDENDGYFDHVPPFTAPHSDRPETGQVSKGIDTKVEYVTREQEKERKGFPQLFDGESPIGLGFRVPLVIASPWSKGGYVNSEVFDHTSTLQFLEHFINQKTGKQIRESNISEWRRTVCGDLTSVFRAAEKVDPPRLAFLQKQPFLESIYNAKYKKIPNDFKALTPDEIQTFQKDPFLSPYMPTQEKGVRPSCALHYELYAEGQLNKSADAFVIRMGAGNELFGAAALGAPFNVYVPGKNMQTRAFAVKASDHLEAAWSLKQFENENYHLQLFGPNGFYREFRGSAKDPILNITCSYEKSDLNPNKATGNIFLVLSNPTKTPYRILITDNAYHATPVDKFLSSSGTKNEKIIVPMNLSVQHGWYDFSVTIIGWDVFEKRYAGRVETGEAGYSDPFMGRTI